MNKYWIYFQGTSNGKFILAKTLKQAKYKFAKINNLNSIAYILGSTNTNNRL
mgnify:CR=1 FL=1